MSQTYPQKIYTNFPDNVSVRDYVKDLDISTKIHYDQYCSHIATGRFNEANKIKDEHLKNVLVDAFFFNGIIDDISALQQLFHDDIESWIYNVSKYIGTYSSSVKYKKFNVVSYAHEGAIQYYQAHELDIPLGTLPTDENYWTCITLRGQKGDPGMGMSYGGLWNELLPYIADQFVVCDNAFWICKSPNTNSRPSKTNGNWELMLEIDASLFVYNNSNSSLNSTTIHGAIDELDEKITALSKITLDVDKWVMSDDKYMYAVSFEGIKPDDCVVLYKCVESETLTEDSSTQYDSDYSKIKSGKSGDGILTIYSLECPETNFAVYLKKGAKGTGELLFGGSASAEKQQISNVVVTITDNTAVAEGGTVVATCNEKSWESLIKNGRAKLYASEVGNYTITVTATDGTVYTTMLVCPYFGQFSTDIYSGTLIVSCTEEGGNGKSCNVRSCDDEYNVTDSYNLTQTFDSGLELTFLGIPSGKYLITVDDRYVFFKEIESIQNINSVNVCLRQYLYNHGSQCEWNTGGWIQCATAASEQNHSNPGFGWVATATAEASVAFLEDRIQYKCSGYAPEKSYVSHGITFYDRGGFSITATIGTKAPLKDISLYSVLHVINPNGIEGSFRSGGENSKTTNINAATILTKGTIDADKGLGVFLDTPQPYLVLGNTYTVTASGNTDSRKYTYNINYSSDITEIWLE